MTKKWEDVEHGTTAGYLWEIRNIPGKQCWKCIIAWRKWQRDRRRGQGKRKYGRHQ